MAYKYSYPKTPLPSLPKDLLCLLSFKTGSLCTFLIERPLVVVLTAISAQLFQLPPWIPFQKKREDAFFLAMMPLAGVIPQES